MQNKSVAIWLFIVVAFICAMVVFGGLVRLTYSGLSIVEWQVVTGVIPPVNAETWLQEFQKYQRTPQYQQLNTGMALADFKFIYYMEYSHRLLGRITGLLFVVPMLVFWAKGVITRRNLRLFIGIGLLFALQGVFGWFMVMSGLVDQPQVSQYRLTGHLLLALVLLAACFWAGLSWYYGPARSVESGGASRHKNLLIALQVMLLVQITLGGMVAGLHAGTLSDTFPKMLAAWIPSIIWSQTPWYKNLFENPFMLHFLHRWWGIVVVLAIIVLFTQLRKAAASTAVRRANTALLILTLAQVALGISTILLHVPVVLASLHQAVMLSLFLLLLFLYHRTEGTQGAR